jgi:hypothetical protein
MPNWGWWVVGTLVSICCIIYIVGHVTTHGS